MPGAGLRPIDIRRRARAMQQQAIPPFAIFDDYRPTVAITVAIRWLLLCTWLAMINYRAGDTPQLTFNIIGAAVAVANAYVTWRVLAGRPITWRHALGLSSLDLIVITAGLYLDGGFQNRFYVFYYPALLGFSLMFPRRASFIALGTVVALYVLMSLTIEPTLNRELFQEKVLVVRVITMVGIVAAGVLLAMWERARRREAVAAERERAQENLELQRRTQEAELAAVEERGRIAREIHDGVAQSIYMLSLQLETCVDLAESNPSGLSDRLKRLVSLSKESLLEVRHYIFDLKPYLAGEKGLANMVESQVREFRNVAGVTTELEISGPEREVSMPVSTCIYRVTQEALANVFKHAQASRVDVRLEYGNVDVGLEIRDDGLGFDTSTKTTGLGLGNMRQRAAELGGSLALDSTVGQGTRVEIRLPTEAQVPA